MAKKRRHATNNVQLMIASYDCQCIWFMSLVVVWWVDCTRLWVVVSLAVTWVFCFLCRMIWVCFCGLPIVSNWQMVMVSHRSNNQAELNARCMFVESTFRDSTTLCVWHDEIIIVSVQRLTQSKWIRIFNEAKWNDTTTFVLRHCPHKSTEFLLVGF